MSNPSQEALSSALISLNDESLFALFAKSSPAEIAIALRLLPLDRSNHALSALDHKTSAAVLELVAADVADHESEEKLLLSIENLQKRKQTWVINALDWLAMRIGTLKRESGV